MKKTRVGWIIHIFSLLHAAVALTSRMAGVEDEILLTILTMTMALIICIKRKFNIEFTAASIIMVNIIGYLLGNAGAAVFSHLMSSQYLIHAIATSLTTEILGWSIVAFSAFVSKNDAKPASMQYIKWIILAMVGIFSIRIGIILLISSNIFASGSMMAASSRVFSSSFALITLICTNVIYIRYAGGFNNKVSTGRQVAYLVVFMICSGLIGALLSSIGIPFDITIESWSEFIPVYIVSLIAQITIYCVVFMVNFTISAGNKMREEKEKKHAAQFRYQKLKRQVNPHFLFNSLNALDCLIWEEKTEKASTYIHKLASVYRYMIKSEDEEMVQLCDELTFVDMYVDLLKVRFPEGFEVIIDVRQEDQARFVLPCSIQLLIENATKHNAVGGETPLVIKVMSDGDKMVVSNNIVPKITKVQSTGLGHKYIRQQYLDISGKEIQITNTDKEYTVTLPLL